VGDAAFQKKCLGKMKDVSQHGRTVLFVSHNMQTIETLCPNSVVFSNGNVVFADTSARCIQYYLEYAKPDLNRNGNHDLSDRTDRQGGGGVSIRDVSFINRNDELHSERIRTGDPICIKIRTEVAHPPATYSVGIGFFSASGSFLCGIKSDSVRDSFTSTDRTNVHYCHIDKFPLAPGEYTFNIIATGIQTTYDWVQDAGTFEVHPGDFYGRGKLPAEGRQGVMIDYSWH
jgi:lipopolysaccharide transport system ATP-binding protein